MSGGDPPIIVQGGSVTIQFDASQLVPDSPFTGLFSNSQKVIKRVEITGTDITNYDETPTGNSVTVKITYGNP
jgi:hypothetical protein